MRVPWTKSLRDSATLQVAALLNAGGNFLSTVGLAHLLGAHEQGRFYVAVALYSLLWFAINLAVVGATVSQVAAANARDQREKAAGWIAFLAKAYLGMGLVLTSAGFFALPWMAEHGLASDPSLGRWAWWLTLTPLLELPRVVLGAAMQGTRNMAPLARTENAQELVRVFLVLTGAVVTGSIAGPVIGMLAASAVGSLVAVELYRNAARRPESRLPHLREIVAQLRAVPLRRGLPLGVKLGFLRSSDALAFEVLPTLVLEKFGSSEWAAYLRIAQRLMGIPVMFMQGVSRTSLPKLSELAGKKEMERFRASFLRVSRTSGVAITCGLLVMLACVPWILEHFFPRDYREPVSLLCKILLPGFALLSLSVANEAFYIVTNTLRVGLLICALGLFVSLSSIPLAQRFPATGAAWGLTLARACTATNFLFALWYFRRARAEEAR